MCLFLYPFTIEVSSVCSDVLDILECTEQQTFVVAILLDASVVQICVKWYTYDIGYKSFSTKLICNKKIPKKRRLH